MTARAVRRASRVEIVMGRETRTETREELEDSLYLVKGDCVLEPSDKLKDLPRSVTYDKKSSGHSSICLIAT